jgi:hypothetical protein
MEHTDKQTDGTGECASRTLLTCLTYPLVFHEREMPSHFSGVVIRTSASWVQRDEHTQHSKAEQNVHPSNRSDPNHNSEQQQQLIPNNGTAAPSMEHNTTQHQCKRAALPRQQQDKPGRAENANERAPTLMA